MFFYSFCGYLCAFGFGVLVIGMGEVFLGNLKKGMEQYNKKKTKKRTLFSIDIRICKECPVGSCCYEGVDLSPQELRRIIRFQPAVKKPWFRLIEASESSQKGYPFSTIIRDGTCVFQDKNNRCHIYPVRPSFCREFPLEGKKVAPFYKRLCVLFYQEWPNNNIKRTYRKREKNQKSVAFLKKYLYSTHRNKTVDFTKEE